MCEEVSQIFRDKKYDSFQKNQFFKHKIMTLYCKLQILYNVNS